MPLLDTFRIEINDDKVFNAGQLVSGKVILKTIDHAPFAGVWIEFFGRAIVDESFKLFPCRSKGNIHLQRHDKLTGKSQLYFKIRKHLTGKSVSAIQNLDDNRRRWNILPDGSYQFSFKFHIPKDRLPSSIKCHQLFVCYSLAACVNLNNHPYYTYKPITLQHEIDVSETGLITSPEPCRLDRNLSIYGCYYHGLVRILAALNRTGYCPGETIFFAVTVTNNSAVTLGKIKIKLHQVFATIPCGKPKRKCCAALKYTTKVRPKTTVKWSPGTMTIPDVPPTMNECTIARINYEFQVIIPIPYDYDFKATFKIVIGTKPPQSMPVQLHDRRSRSQTNWQHSRNRLEEEFDRNEDTALIKKFKNTMTWDCNDDEDETCF